MGKGKGKLSDWAAKVITGSIIIEFSNVRFGRVKYFLKYLIFRLPGKFKIMYKGEKHITLSAYKSMYIRLQNFY